MRAAALRVADVFRAHWAEYDRTHTIAPHQAKAVRHILSCRTAALGGHLHRCAQCGSELPVYNSCEDRHCSTCQTLAKEAWLDDRRAELLPVEYFHAVFTLSHGVNGLVDANRRLLLGELFAAAHWVLRHFAADPAWRLEGELGFIALLHTWNQRLGPHFHLHCIVPGGVWRAGTQQWVPCRQRYLFEKDALAAAFRNRYLRRLGALRAQGKLRFTGAAAGLADAAVWDAWLRARRAENWVVWPKRTAAGPEQALDYLGRYTHRVALADHRLLRFEAGQVTFAWRDRAHGNRRQTQQLPAAEFIQRFLYHVLPPGFQKVRYYGWLCPQKKTRVLPAIRGALGAAAPPPAAPVQETKAERILRLTGVDVRRCPQCGASALVYVGPLAPVYGANESAVAARAGGAPGRLTAARGPP